MNKTFILSGAMVMMLVFAGCTGEELSPGDQPQPTQQTQPEDTLQPGDGPKLTYELPEGWEFHPETKLKARLNREPKDSVLPFVILDVMTWKSGALEDAEAKAKQHFEEQKNAGEEPSMTEVEIAGVRAYVIELHTNSYWGEYWWNTNIVFYRDGHVGSFTISDRYENQKEAVESVIKTLTLTQ